MATDAERRALMAVPCDWCGAQPYEACYPRSDSQKRNRRRITTLDGGCHDSRWYRALGRDAPVLAANIRRSERPRVLRPPERPW
jgi:hypothetical protein